MISNLELFSQVAILSDLPEHGLARGQVGTVVDVHSPTDVEVEFIDDDGNTCALTCLSSSVLIRLHHQPLTRAA